MNQINLGRFLKNKYDYDDKKLFLLHCNCPELEAHLLLVTKKFVWLVYLIKKFNMQIFWNTNNGSKYIILFESEQKTGIISSGKEILFQFLYIRKILWVYRWVWIPGTLHGHIIFKVIKALRPARVLLLVTKKFVWLVYLIKNLSCKFFGTPATARKYL